MRGRGAAWLALAAACTGNGPGDGTMTVTWTGADTAEFSAAAIALWCATPRWLEVVGQRGDTGVGLVVYPVAGESLAGVYPVTPPAADTVPDSLAAPRPGAALAARWFTGETVEGYEALGGTITIVGGMDRVEGTFQGTLRSAFREDTLVVVGRFGLVTPAQDGIECEPADTAANKLPGPDEP